MVRWVLAPAEGGDENQGESGACRASIRDNCARGLVGAGLMQRVSNQTDSGAMKILTSRCSGLRGREGWKSAVAEESVFIL